MIKSRTFNVFLISFLLVAFILPQHAQATQQGTLEVAPAYQEVVLEKPDEEKIVKFTYTNQSTEPLSLELYPIDFKQQGENGEIGFLGRESGSYSYSLSSFLTFESNVLDLDPGETHTFEVQVKNRQDISPGGHYAAIVARQVQTAGETSVAPAVSALIFMRKSGGERFNLSVQKLTWPRFPVAFSIPSTIALTFQNAGNIHVVPYGTIEVIDSFGRVVRKGVLNTSSLIIMPESRRLVPGTLREVSYMLPISLNSMQIKGSDSLRKVSYVHQESFLYVNPWTLLGLPVIGLGVLFLRRKRKKA